ncbi:multiple RNA-binding domain-containing protein 1-like [Ananas comosus]|uniref:Multiple RNA-binding domain-containing protein 1-like n=1 Tax=Ananas comosus TaxID=4615 RepID=A0A6P5G4A0_ANACO|nr:multiple RNA-binding domain-containing protein 1-like [Ananas comosus]
MSRLCVKNLPKYVNEDRLREFFSQKGEVTDAKIMRTKDGKSRQFAFIGFRSEKEAEAALNYFNNTFMDTRKLICEVARKVGDLNLPRPWSRYSLKRSTHLSQSKDNAGVSDQVSLTKISEGEKLNANLCKSTEVNDPKLQEFLQVMQPRSKSKLWANDAIGAGDFVDKDSKINEKDCQQPQVGQKQAARPKTRTTDGSSGEPEATKSTSSEENEVEESLETREHDHMTDMEYFKSRIKKNWSDAESSDSDDEDSKSQTDMDINNENSPSKMQERDANGLSVGEDDINGEEKESPLVNSDGEDVNNENPTSSVSDEKKQALETGRLFIRNLPYTTTEEDLMELFSQFGDVSHVHLVVDKDTKRSKGIGYVLFSLPESAIRALEELDNSSFQGRLLHVMPAKPQNDEKLESNHVVENKTFKQLRADQRKASEASGDTRAWNSLFMRPDTVVENIARKTGVSKSELLDRDADDLAVRIALGETHVVAETKKALSNAGINIAALEEYAVKKNENMKRSNHVILVKNLPYSSSEGDLASMFGKFGSLDKVVLPPTRTLALVIFLEAAEARSAFKCLAYKRYKDAPLYLEWAPENIFCPTPPSACEEQKNVVGEKNVKKVLVEESMEGVPEEDIDPDRVESRSIFVKNLNFKTLDESLKLHFSNNMKNGTIKSVKVKKHLKNGKFVSMGFGFIEFDSVETATSVCKDLQGTVLDGHALSLQLCHGKRDGQVSKKGEKDRSSTKLIVRNVAFEATEKDLRQLFSPFGQIKSLRLPMKFRSHRGFAFVEYVTKHEAQNALQALANTHLYGRHLVIERAKEGESLEELRARTAAQFTDDVSGFQRPSKRAKK